ncbi:MAG TPA: hypothetical protein VHT03_11375 [Rhizomicrobium sp.]|jgi:hypothetical protein|nr:hypothetical protein [Rhizomicrobium sp.]
MSFSRFRNFAAPVSATALCALVAIPARGELSISSAYTKNLSCSNGVCTATARNAVLNVDDLTNQLGSGDVKVATGGATDDIRVETSFGWSGAGLLTLDAARSVSVNQTVKVGGSGSLAVIINDGGNGGLLSFGAKGRVAFANLGGALTVNGQAYTLVGKISTLAAGIAKNPDGHFALASNYDAQGDGTYSSPPISTIFTGAFEGLGNTIANLSINDPNGTQDGLFLEIGSGGLVADIRLANANVTSNAIYDAVPTGTLVGLNKGTILGAVTSGSVSGSAQNYPFVGGLAGESMGSIANSRSAASVTAGDSGSAGGLVGVVDSGTVYASSASGIVSAGQGSNAGGLVGINAGLIELCFATGAVNNAVESKTGGLVGFDTGPLSDSYATGSASQDGQLGYVGGVVGFFQPSGTDTLSRNYSTGAVSGGNETGGFVGFDNSSGKNLAQNDWDMTTSGISNPADGAGFPASDPGIKGLTSQKLQARLPRGFQRSTWALDSAINQGFPYLRANPPQN